MIDNKKLAKEFANIYASTNKAKQITVAEIGKIDEKYRRLAEEEKKNLNETVKMLDAQLEFYGNLLGLNTPAEQPQEKTPAVQEEVAPEVVEETEEVEREEKIVDTIFEENNEEAEAEEEPEVETTAKDLDAEEDAEWEERIESGELKQVEPVQTDEFSDIWPEESAAPAEETEDKKETVEEEDEWPEMPQEWQ